MSAPVPLTPPVEGSPAFGTVEDFTEGLTASEESARYEFEKIVLFPSTDPRVADLALIRDYGVHTQGGSLTFPGGDDSEAGAEGGGPWYVRVPAGVVGEGEAGMTVEEHVGAHLEDVVIILCHGGYFAAAAFHQGRLGEHKTFRKYITRRKQGGRQSTRDRSGRVMFSAGSHIRRTNEEKLTNSIRELLTGPKWAPILAQAQAVFLFAPGPANKEVFFGTAASRSEDASIFPLSVSDPRIKGLGMKTHRPKTAECVRVFDVLCTGFILRPVVVKSSSVTLRRMAETPGLLPAVAVAGRSDAGDGDVDFDDDYDLVYDDDDSDDDVDDDDDDDDEVDDDDDDDDEVDGSLEQEGLQGLAVMMEEELAGTVAEELAMTMAEELVDLEMVADDDISDAQLDAELAELERTSTTPPPTSTSTSRAPTFECSGDSCCLVRPPSPIQTQTPPPAPTTPLQTRAPTTPPQSRGAKTREAKSWGGVPAWGVVGACVVVVGAAAAAAVMRWKKW